MTTRQKLDQLLLDERFYIRDGELWCKPKSNSTWREAKIFWNSNCLRLRPHDPKEAWRGFPASSLKPYSTLCTKIVEVMT